MNITIKQNNDFCLFYSETVGPLTVSKLIGSLTMLNSIMKIKKIDTFVSEVVFKLQHRLR